MTLNWKPRFKSFLSICEVMLSKPTWLLGKTVAVWDMFVIEVGGALGNVGKREWCQYEREVTRKDSIYSFGQKVKKGGTVAAKRGSA